MSYEPEDFAAGELVVAAVRVAGALKSVLMRQTPRVAEDLDAHLAARWSEVFDRPVSTSDADHPQIALDDATVRFVPVTDERGLGLGGLDMQTVDRARVLEAAEARGCRVSDDHLIVCGVRFRLL